MKYNNIYDELNDLCDNYGLLISSLNEANNYLKNNIVLGDSVDNNVINTCKNCANEDLFKIKQIINICKFKIENGDNDG